MESKKNINILVVDDEAVIRDFFIQFFSPNLIKTAEDGFKAVELAKSEKFDLVFLDIRMPVMNGLQAFVELKKLNPGMVCVFMTGYALEESLLEKMKREDMLCLRKPFEDIRQIKKIAEDAALAGEETVGTEKSPKDRRAYLRLDVELEVDYRLSGQTGGLISAMSKNISPNGIKILSSQKASLGAFLDLTIKFPCSKEVCAAVGEVIWLRQARENAEYYNMGIKFKDIDLSCLTNLLVHCSKILNI